MIWYNKFFAFVFDIITPSNNLKNKNKQARTQGRAVVLFPPPPGHFRGAGGLSHHRIQTEGFIIIFSPWNGLKWATKGSSLRRLLRTSKINTEIYIEWYIIIYIVLDLGLQWATSGTCSRLNIEKQHFLGQGGGRAKNVFHASHENSPPLAKILCTRLGTNDQTN